MRAILTISLMLLFLTLPALPVLAQALNLGEFEAGRLNGWEPELFEGETQYQLVRKGEFMALEGRSEASASGLVKKLEIDINRYPYLNWSWMATRILQGNEERIKEGDDFPVRLYVVVSGGIFFWQTRALNYVWSRNQPVGSHWPNPFTGNAIMLAVESGEQRLNQWVSYKRNVKEDLKRYLGMEVDKVHAVALMVDTDNTGQAALSFFRDITFTEN